MNKSPAEIYAEGWRHAEASNAFGRNLVWLVFAWQGEWYDVVATFKGPTMEADAKAFADAVNALDPQRLALV